MTRPLHCTNPDCRRMAALTRAAMLVSATHLERIATGHKPEGHIRLTLKQIARFLREEAPRVSGEA